jgi:amidase
MARTVGDLALMLTAISGRDPRSPLSHGDPAAFVAELRGQLVGLRVAWCPDLGGLPIEPEVLQVLGTARAQLDAAGCDVRDVAIDLSAADEAFETLRAVSFVRAFAPILPTLRKTAKEALLWNIEQGMALDGPAVARAIAARSAVFATVAELLERFDVLVAPAAQVVPFAIDLEYPAEVAGVVMPHYLGWMRVCSRITVSSHPVAAVPAGFTDSGLPVGMQFVGRYGQDRRLLEYAAAWEASSGLSERHPPLE